MIVAHIEDPDGLLAGVEIAGPGYLNFRFSPRFWQACLAEVEQAGLRPARARRAAGACWSSSSAPTPPARCTSATAAARCSATSSRACCAAAGYDVTREYYVNDAGKQMATLGALGLRARCCRRAGATRRCPEDGYPGEYLRDLMVERPRRAAARRSPRPSGRAAAGPRGSRDGLLRARARRRASRSAARRAAELAARGDQGGHARARRRGRQLRQRARAARRGRRRRGARRRSRQRGLLYEAEGARWFRSTAFGDEKDRVVQRSRTASSTYFAADIGYHRQKLARGFDELIDVWGADHHGYVQRVEGGDRGARRRSAKRLHVDPGPARPPDARRRAGAHGQAQRRVRHHARGGRRGRARRDALLLPHAQGRQPPRLRPRAGEEAVGGEPGLLRAVRARAHLQPVPTGGGRGAQRARAPPTADARRARRAPRSRRS